MTSRKHVAAALVSIALMALPADARLPVAVVTSAAYRYVPGDGEHADVPVQVAEGGRLRFVNLDYLGYHTVTAVDDDGTGAPLFDSIPIGMGEQAIVEGVERLAPGRYGFFCVVHNPVMQGVLEVVPPLP